MMLLDCGNTALKWQRWQDQCLLQTGGLSYQTEWLASFGQLLRQSGETSCFLTSVLDAQRQSMLDDCLGRLCKRVERLQSAAEALGVTSAYRDPASLGDDRWMALLAAHQLAPQGSLVIDAGSAITLDLLAADGRHLGGAIIPGTRTSRDHFRQIFDYLDLSELQADPARSPGCSTPEAIHIDYRQDSLDILLALVERWQGLLDGCPAVLLAGGDANRVEKRLQRPVRRVPDLVFRGMRRLIDNRGK